VTACIRVVSGYIRALRLVVGLVTIWISGCIREGLHGLAAALEVDT
jgi:hypothetical protein